MRKYEILQSEPQIVGTALDSYAYGSKTKSKNYQKVINTWYKKVMQVRKKF